MKAKELKSLSMRELKELTQCRCDEQRYCSFHQGMCARHTQLTADEGCTCEVVSKDEAIKLKARARMEYKLRTLKNKSLISKQ